MLNFNFYFHRFSLRNLKNFGWAGQTMEELVLEDAENLTIIINEAAQAGVIKNLNEVVALAVLNSLWSLLGGSRYLQLIIIIIRI